MVRRTLRLMLDVEQDIDVIAEAVDLAAMMSHVRQHMPRVLVLDLRLPNGMSTETIRQLRKEFPETERGRPDRGGEPTVRAEGHRSRRHRVRCQ
jgi:DNA-binding NarL/FixJ family response regulator